MKYAVGYSEQRLGLLGHLDVYDSEEEEYEITYADTDGTVYSSEQHMYMEEHYSDFEDEDGDGTMNCDCKQIVTKKPAAEIAAIKAKWKRDNFTFVEPDKESIKVVLEICKQLATLWGANIPTTMPTIFDQRKQTIQIGDNNEQE